MFNIYFARWQSNEYRVNWGQPPLRASPFNLQLAFVRRHHLRRQLGRQKSKRKFCRAKHRGSAWAWRNRDAFERDGFKLDWAPNSSPSGIDCQTRWMPAETKEAVQWKGTWRLPGEEEARFRGQKGSDHANCSDCWSGQRLPGILNNEHGGVGRVGEIAHPSFLKVCFGVFSGFQLPFSGVLEH